MSAEWAYLDRVFFDNRRNVAPSIDHFKTGYGKAMDHDRKEDQKVNDRSHGAQEVFFFLGLGIIDGGKQVTGVFYVEYCTNACNFISGDCNG